MQKKVIVFDLFDTLLNVKQTNFKSGLYLLWKNHFADVCEFEDMGYYSDELYYVMKDCQSKNVEFSFVDDFIPMSCKKFGIELFQISPKEECEIISAISKCYVLPETVKLLTNMESIYSIYIISNSIFRSEALCEFLNQHSIGLYIKDLFSSSDFGIRKPSTILFDMCFDEINKTNHMIQKKDVLFVGNSYKCDAVGGYNAGFSSVWLNLYMEDNIYNLPIKTINNLPEIHRLLFEH